ncbi:hypothetical protein [Vibrio parahaemolyticus]|uniref:hypothetical protein n=1 Tax=Vibrio parahaemolyticus TaxID=670 RepID=UPI000649AA87|nr:hypothetical protein [Vibrio parahaemolyticus]EII3125343.1 hypothetical protein [Vibrio parahaemolyticus]
MSDFQPLIESNRRLTETVENKVSEIDQSLANAEQKIDDELNKIQTKLPRIIITRNQFLDLDADTGLPIGMSINGNVTVTEHITITQHNVKSAEQLALLEEMETDMGCNLRKTSYYRRPFKVLKMSWTNSAGWLAFPQAADDAGATSIPVNSFITLGAFVKVLSGSVSGAWSSGNKLGQWVFCNSKWNPAGFGAYSNLHPIPSSESGELLVALPAAITGHVDTPEQWFPNISLG